jgi:hypothetical protein
MESVSAKPGLLPEQKVPQGSGGRNEGAQKGRSNLSTKGAIKVSGMSAASIEAFEAISPGPPVFVRLENRTDTESGRGYSDPSMSHRQSQGFGLHVVPIP